MWTTAVVAAASSISSAGFCPACVLTTTWNLLRVEQAGGIMGEALDFGFLTVASFEGTELRSL